jgi:hypothetical protein
MKKKIKVAYITWGETPRSYGVFGSQVVEQISRIARNHFDTIEMHFLAFLPIIHSGWIREKFGYFSEINKVKKILSHVQFHLKFLPIPQNLVNPTKLTHQLLFIWGLSQLQRYIEQNDIDIVHCRSIHAAYAACKVKLRSSKSFRIVFDIRSPWPETIALQRNYNEDHPEYQYFKSIEKFIVNSCDSLVAVSATMSRYFEKSYGKSCDLIYLSAPVESLQLKNIVNKSAKNLHLIYVGALDEDGWHKISTLITLLLRIRSIFPDCAVTIVTTSSYKIIQNKITEAGLNNINIASAFNIDQLKNYLFEANIACLTALTPGNKLEKIFCENVFAVKSVEYLSAGLPIICNKFLGGAAAYVKEHGVGLLYDPNDLSTLRKEDIERLINSDISKKAVALSWQDFDYDSNAKKYFELYKSINKINNKF